MKNLDLEKLIIVLSLILIPVAGVWIYLTEKELDKADKAFKTCKKTIENIHGLQELIRLTKAELNKPGGDVDNPRSYFQNRAMASQTDESIVKADEFKITVGEGKNVRRTGGKGPIIGTDIEVKVEFGKGQRGGRKPLPRSFINAFIVNCESRSPIWKLRHLSISNKDFKGARSGSNSTPPLEMGDEWLVSGLVFARLKPKE